MVNGPSRQDAEPGEKRDPGERHTRLSGAWTALVIGVLALVVILVFILQNLQSVELSFLVFHGRLPLAVALLFAVILGAVIVMAFGGARIRQLRRVTRRARRPEGPPSPQAR
jgi:lipopolysaccharide assembly protein A